MRVGFTLVDKKRPRVLTAALSAAAAQHGFDLVALNPSSTAQWESENVDVIVHKVPEDSDLDAKLLAYKQGHPATVLLDPPAAVRAVQDRVCMLAPLTDKQLILTLQQQPQQLEQPLQTQMPRHNEHQTVSISAPTQVTFPSGCSADEALQWLATAGLTYPALVKPLITAPPDSCAAAAAATAPGLLVSNANHSSRDGHALGALLSAEGVQQLVAGECDPTLQLPIVVQQFVPHGEALYKLYVMGPHVVLTRRTTLTQEQLYASARAVGRSSVDSKAGLVLLNRVSALPLSTVVTATDSQQQQQHVDAMQQSASSEVLSHQQINTQHARPDPRYLVARTDMTNTCIGTRTEEHQSQEHLQTGQPQDILAPAGNRGSITIPASLATAALPGVALADASVTGDATAPPLWAMQQLAAYLRQQLQLSLFNVDIIAPTNISVFDHKLQQPHIAHLAQQPFGKLPQKGPDSMVPQQITTTSNLSASDLKATTARAGVCGGVRQYLVVDINFFPGYDKVPGAELLFADFLSSLRPD